MLLAAHIQTRFVTMAQTVSTDTMCQGACLLDGYLLQTVLLFQLAGGSNCLPLLVEHAKTWFVPTVNRLYVCRTPLHTTTFLSSSCMGLHVYLGFLRNF